MIIECINCNKKFEVNSSLIPDLGRNIQCGSCNHIWFYKPIATESSSPIVHQNIDIPINQSDEIIEKEVKIDQKKQKTSVNKQVLSKETKTNKYVNAKKSTGSILGKILSYLLVAAISFIAVIIILDTFKSPLSNIIPSLELVLYNLFESIKDIFLFIKDLSI